MMQPIQIEVRARGKLTASFTVNDEPAEFAFAPSATLLEVLREELALTGTKHGCELGECGTCTVLVNDEPVLSCLVLAATCEGRRVTTVEGLARGAELHPLQQAFVELGAAQCGYCTPGFLMSAAALLHHNHSPTRGEIAHALSGNLCRCTGYLKIFEAVELATQRMYGGDGGDGDGSQRDAGGSERDPGDSERRGGDAPHE
jgi:carbon-monoxide dehydrogenase small subunit